MNISFFLGIFIPFFKVHFLASLFLRVSKKCFVPKNIAPPEYIPIHTLVCSMAINPDHVISRAREGSGCSAITCACKVFR